MKVYADTAFLVSFHIRDANTSKAIQQMRMQQAPLPWSWLHHLEFRNALRQRIFRGDMTEHDVSLVLAKAEHWMQRGLYRDVSFSDLVPPEAERLSMAHTSRLGTRSLDILHVAHAKVLGAEEFLTFDQRQAALANAAGLKVLPL